jgi:hypothetical protein
MRKKGKNSVKCAGESAIPPNRMMISPLISKVNPSNFAVVGYFHFETGGSKSFVERQNWTVRGTMRRYTRLSNGFSRKMENHAAATALNYFA